MGGKASKDRRKEPPQISGDEMIRRVIELPFVTSVLPMNVLYIFHNYDRNVLTAHDQDVVKAITRSRGDTEGAMELLDRLHKYPNWYPCLQNVLRNPQVKLSHVAESLDELIECAHGNMSVPREENTVDEAADINLLLIGKTGAGKSATGNSILLKNAFESIPGTKSVTKDIDYDYSEFGNFRIKIIDTPGVADTEMTSEQNRSHLANMIAKAIIATPSGYHAFLLVFPFGHRFTNEEVECIETLKHIFGSEFIMDHTVLILTKGDEYSDHTSAIHEWCERQNDTFRELYEKCDRRAVIFDNKTQSQEKRRKQVDDLLQMIKRQFYGRRRYDSRIFSVASKYFKWKLYGQIINENIVRELAIITSQLTITDMNEYVDLSQRMEKLQHMQFQYKGEDDKKTMQDLYDQVRAVARRRDVVVKKIKEEEQKIWDQWEKKQQQIEEQWEIPDAKKQSRDEAVRHAKWLGEKTAELQRELDKRIEIHREECTDQWHEESSGILKSYKSFKRRQLYTQAFKTSTSLMSNIIFPLIEFPVDVLVTIGNLKKVDSLWQITADTKR